jgi:hypothetical protein
MGSDSPCLLIELGIGQADFIGFAIAQEGLGMSLRLLLCSPAEDIDQRFWCDRTGVLTHD